MFEDILGKAADAISKGAEAVKNGAESVKKAQENSKIISDEHPLTTAGLEVYPNKLKYKKIRCNFNDIEHINIEWISKTTNGVINTQDVTVTIYIKNNERVVVSKTTMYVEPKLVRAYNYYNGLNI